MQSTKSTSGCILVLIALMITACGGGENGEHTSTTADSETSKLVTKNEDRTEPTTPSPEPTATKTITSNLSLDSVTMNSSQQVEVNRATTTQTQALPSYRVHIISESATSHTTPYYTHTINNNDIVGLSGAQQGNSAIWSQPSGFTELPAIGGGSSIRGINSQLQIAGNENSPTFRGLVWDKNGTPRRIPNPIGGYNTYAVGIDESGQIAGTADSRDGQSMARVWNFSDLSSKPIPSPADNLFCTYRPERGCASYASAINQKGKILVGGVFFDTKYQNSPNYTVSVTYTYDTLTGLTQQLPQTAPTLSIGINNLGSVIGSRHFYSVKTGLLDTTLNNLVAINDHNNVVGSLIRTSNGTFRETGYIWNIDNGAVELNSLINPTDPLFGKSHIRLATGISNSNKISAIVLTDKNDPSSARSALLIPMEPPPLGPFTLVDPTAFNGTSLLRGTRIIAPDPAKSSDIFKLATSGRVVEGIASDGVAQVIIRIPAHSVGEQVYIKIKDGQCNTTGAACIDSFGRVVDLNNQTDAIYTNTPDSNSSVTAIAQDTPLGPMAFVAYRAPSDFVRTDNGTNKPEASLAKRTVTLTITSQQTNVYQDFDVTVVRPPIVLVHGLWADAKNWNKSSAPGDFRSVGTTLGNDARFSVSASNYGGSQVKVKTAYPEGLPNTLPGSSLGVLYGATFTLKHTKSAIDSYASGTNNTLSLPIASAQADLVAHSMGAVVSRKMQYLPNFFSGSPYGRGFIHKIISLGGPHLGSPLASELLKRGRHQDFGIDNSCVRGILNKAQLYVVETYVDSSGTTRTGAIADLTGTGDGASMSAELSQLKSNGALPVAYVSGIMNAQSLAALSAQSPYPLTKNSPTPDYYTYRYNGTVHQRKLTGLDNLKFACGNFFPSIFIFSTPSPIIENFFEDRYEGFMGNGVASRGSSDGIVPVLSQRNGQRILYTDISVPISPSRTSGAVHSGGAVLLGLGVVDTLGDFGDADPETTSTRKVKTLLDADAADATVRLINTPVSAEIFIKRQ